MTLKNAQGLLIELGYDLGRSGADGVMGPKTKAAIAEALAEFAPPAPVTAAPIAFDDNTRQLIKELEGDEGRVLHAYKDSLGYLTIGIGRLIDAKKGGGITNEEADYLKANDIRRITSTLDVRYPWWRQLSPARQRAFANMAFQLGTSWPEEFKATASLIKSGQFAQAASNLRGSLWYKQTPERAERVIRLYEKG